MRAVAAMDVLYTQVLAAPVKIPLNIIRGRSPFHGIAGIGEEKKEKKKEEPAEAIKAAAAPAAAAVAAAAAPAPAPAAAPKKKRWFWQKEPIPEANPEEKIKPAPVRKDITPSHGAPEV